jgi:hypothetical protein
MSLSTDESPNFTEALPTEIDPAARAFPGRVRGQRIEVTSADLTMYSAITGRAPSAEERERALTWSEGDPMHGEIAQAVASDEFSADSPTSNAILSADVATRSWHPLALTMRLREMWLNGFSLRMSRPQISNWVRRLSQALQQGRRRVRQAR